MKMKISLFLILSIFSFLLFLPIVSIAENLNRSDNISVLESPSLNGEKEQKKLYIVKNW